jgi:hypothetical protein
MNEYRFCESSKLALKNETSVMCGMLKLLAPLSQISFDFWRKASRDLQKDPVGQPENEN